MTLATRDRTPDAPGREHLRADVPVVLHTRVVSGTGGGPDKTILNSPRFLNGRGYRLFCAFMHPPDDPGFEQLRDRARRLEAPLVSVPDRGPWDWRVVGQLLRICRRERVVIWHGHDYKSNALGLLLRRSWPMHLVTTVHGWVTHTGRTPLYYGIDRFCLPRFERVLCVSEDLRDRCVWSGVPEDRCILVDNAVDVRHYVRTLETEEAKRRLGVPPGRLLIGAVGRLSDEKGFDLLIRAVDRLLANGMDLELRIAGDGDRLDELRSLVERLGRGDRVRLLGFEADLLPFYQALDLFALSSLREGLPNVLLEAMALGVPIVATRVAGVPRLVGDGGCGLLVAPGSVEELAGAIARLGSDPAFRSSLGRGGREAVERRLSFEVRMQKIRAIYDDVLGDAAPTIRPESTTP